MKPVGHLVKYPNGLAGERGVYYNYVLASNGLFIEAESPVIAARIPVAACEVRGLAPLETKISLTYGSIPQRFWDLSLDAFLADPENEHYVAVVADKGYSFYVPVQDRGGARVAYAVGDKIVLDLHSHGRMFARFSGQDNADETGLKLYGVVGSLHTTPVVNLRVGVYGYFKSLSWRDVFDGSLAGAVEYEREEVISEGDVYCKPERPEFQLEDPGSWLRWDRWLCR